MKSIGAPTFDIKTTIANAAWRTRALQKPKATAGSYGKDDNGAQQPARRERKPEPVHARQNGTHGHVPFRHAAPHLTAAFTAQLLGQLLPDPERRSLRVYNGERFTLLPGFDAKY